MDPINEQYSEPLAPSKEIINLIKQKISAFMPIIDFKILECENAKKDIQVFLDT